jgi:hypothetical protein
MFRKLKSKFAEGTNVEDERLVDGALFAIIEAQCPRVRGAALRGLTEYSSVVVLMNIRRVLRRPRRRHLS